jgi:hypothetical protein
MIFQMSSSPQSTKQKKDIMAPIKDEQNRKTIISLKLPFRSNYLFSRKAYDKTTFSIN